jgi:hypothetical protein
VSFQPAGNGSDPLVVRTIELAGVLDKWIREWRSERPLQIDANRWKQPGELFMGAIEALSQRSGIPERSIARVRRLETKWTNLHIADALLTAIERPELMSDGTVNVVPNPRMSLERWIEYLAETGATCES